MSNNSDEDYGPALPPGFSLSKNSNEKKIEIGPALPQHLLSQKYETNSEKESIGPALPSILVKNIKHDSWDKPYETKDEDHIGPLLPPHLSDKLKLIDKAYIGPALPPSFQNKESEDDKEENCIGPVLPPHLSKKLNSEEKSYIGPVLPASNHQKDTDEEENQIGPVLPPHLINKSKSVPTCAIGPAMPTELLCSKGDNCDTEYYIGPKLPSHLSHKSTSGSCKKDFSSGASKIFERNNESSDDDDEIIGPLPSEMMTGDSSRLVAQQLELRAQQMRDKLDGKLPDESEKVTHRESWMTELPSTKLGQSIGLSARTFRSHAGPDLSDQSMWTDTPADKERKLREGKDKDKSHKRKHEDKHRSSRDKKMKKQVEEYNKSNRSTSLYDMHQKKLEKEKKKEKDESKVRKPFDRETDLQVNRFDDAQRKAIIKKSQKLDSRFGHGSTEFL